jgi:hypothetical protein
MRFFNTAGPVNCDDHYCLPPLERFDLAEIEMLLAQKKYFVLHAPRQTGKTTSMLALVDHLNAGNNYRALYCNVETAQTAREDVAEGIKSVLVALGNQADSELCDDFLLKHQEEILSMSGAHDALKVALTRFCRASELPLVLVLDEIDALVGDTLISVLRQIRSGYPQRPGQFPSSIVLCGVRDVRDYRIHSGSGKEIITGGSAFNIKAKSLRMGDFVKEEVGLLMAQHTDETGQSFTPDAVACIWHLSQGQPWLVNALAYEVCFEMKDGRNRTRPIDKEMVDQAKENLILRRETHLDQLADKLREARVRRVVAGLLGGQAEMAGNLPEDDIQYVTDLGLIRSKPQITIANPIYREIIPRMLTYSTQVSLNHQTAWYITPDNRLDMDKLMKAFQEFFQEHSAHWLERFQYREAGPQLLLQAFLQRIINSGGRIEREYGLGRQRVDLLVMWPLEPEEAAVQAGRPAWTRWQGPVQKVVVELKVLHKGLESTIANGLDQTRAYMDTCGTSDGHLVIFNRDPDVPWEDKIFHRTETCRKIPIHIWGM